MGRAIDDFGHFALRRDGLSHYGRIPERGALQRIPHDPDRGREPEILLVEDSLRVHHATLVRRVAGQTRRTGFNSCTGYCMHQSPIQANT